MKFEDLVRSFGIFKGYLKENRSLEKDLSEAHLNVSSEEYSSFSLCFCLLCIITAMPLFSAILDVSLLTALSISIFFSSLAFAFLRYYLKSRKKKIAKDGEAELPFFLRTISSNLSIKRPFEKSIPKQGFLAKIFRSEIEKHNSISKALVTTASKFDSVLIKRALSQLSLVYAQGRGEEMLKKLADEIIELQKESLREFSAKISMLGLMFIAVACLVPSMFNAYITIGTSILGFSFTKMDIYLTYMVVFPALDLVLVVFMVSSVPKFMETRKHEFLSKEEISSLSYIYEIYLPFISEKISLKNFFLLLFIISIFSSLFFYFGIAEEKTELHNLMISFFLLFTPIFFYFLLQFLSDERIRSIENSLPHALFHAASFPPNFPFEKIMKSIGQGKYGELSKEFMKVHREINGGGSVSEALRAMALRNSSILVNRAIELIRLSYIGGQDIAKGMKETADDIFSLFAVVRERKSILAMQKYTLLFGGAIIIPIVMGSVSGVMREFPENVEMFEAGVQSMEIYLVIYALLSSLVVAYQEDQAKKFFLYFAALAPLSLILFNLAKSGMFGI